MLLDWLIFGILIFGLAKLLNSTAFKAKPASHSAAWGLTIAVFFLNLAALSIIKSLRYKAISDSLGGVILPKNPIDWVGALVFTTLFFSFLRREQKKQITASPQEEDLTKPEPQPMPQINDIRLKQNISQDAQPHLEEIEGLPITNANHKTQIPLWSSKFLILLIVFLVVGVVGGIGLIHLFSDSEEEARNKLAEMNITFNEKTFF
jgi:hypothetical protein